MGKTTFERLNHAGQLKAYIVQLGKDENGVQLPLKMEYVGIDEVKGMSATASFKSLHVEATREGKYTIVTEFYLDYVTETGYSPASANRILRFETRDDEAQTFVNNLLPMTERNIMNALAAGGENEFDEGFIGHPNNRFFSASGVPQNDEAHKTALPTYDYRPHEDPVNP